MYLPSALLKVSNCAASVILNRSGKGSVCTIDALPGASGLVRHPINQSNISNTCVSADYEAQFMALGLMMSDYCRFSHNKHICCSL